MGQVEGQEASTHVVEDGEATNEGAQIEEKPPAADRQGAPEAAADTASPPCPHTSRAPRQAASRADLASQNFLVRQGRSWFRRLRNQRWVCRSVRPHCVARTAIRGWERGEGAQGQRWSPIPVPEKVGPSFATPSPAALDLTCGAIYLW